MKIQYLNIKKRLRNNLIMGFGLLIWSIILIFLPESDKIKVLGFLVISLGYFGLYLYLRKSPYLTIENDLIYKNSLFSSKIALSEIKSIDKKINRIIIVTDNSILSIDTQLIDKESLAELKAILKITE